MRTIFLCFLLLFIGVNMQSLQLFSVSSSSTSIINPTGSVRGGTTLYINGLGFSPTSNNNQIFLGTYPCQIPSDGSTETTLACITSDTHQWNNIYNLPIIVISNGQQQRLTNEQGCFSYLNSMTPVIYALYPATAVVGDVVRFYGIHRVSNLGDGLRDLGDVKAMLVGDMQCSRFDIKEGPIQANNYETISCKLAPVQEAGKYSVREYVVPGYSTPAFFMRRSSFLRENYHFALLSSVSSVFPKSGFIGGQILTISGTGFSTNYTMNSVSVDGNKCKVISSTNNQIKCDLQSRNYSKTSKIETNIDNNTNQTKGYFSGTGLHYKRYDISRLSQRNTAGLRAAILNNSSSISLVQSGFRGQIKTGDYYGTNYGQAFTGYFTAPAFGQYTFRGVADDIFALYLSNSTFGTVNTASVPLIYSNSVQNYNNFYLPFVRSAQNSVFLEAGASYYIQVYHINFGGSGFLKISAQVPNNDSSLTWQTNAVHRLDLSFTNDPQIIQFAQNGGTSGIINLTLTFKQVGKPSIVQWAAINYNANITEFMNAIRTFDAFSSSYQMTGILTTYDINGDNTTDPNQIYSYVWQLTVYLLRPPSAVKTVLVPKFVKYSGLQSFTQNIVHSHGPLISGSFGLTIGGVQLMYSGMDYFRYNIPAGELQSSFRSIPGFQNVQIIQLSGPSQYGSSYLISYYGYNNQIPSFQFYYQNLNGGLQGTKPQFYLTSLRDYSSNLLVEPIDFSFLNMPSDNINVMVTVNDIPSVCVGDCGYDFIENAPQLIYAEAVNSTVSLSIEDGYGIILDLKDISIVIGDQNCTVTNITDSTNNFNCELPINNDYSPKIQAGNYLPIITDAKLGKLTINQTVQSLFFPLSITNISSSSGSLNGGYQLIIQGNGFAKDVGSNVIKICNKRATVVRASNIQIVVLVPSCQQAGTQNICIFQGQITSNSIQFNYVDTIPTAKIYQIYPQSHNPSLKGIMQITGVGFGNNISNVRVDLANSSVKVYRMRILQLNDTFVKTGIPGGLTGKFKVQVYIMGVGQAYPNSTRVNQFYYQLIINSVTPNFGSYYGGTLINIKGINFSPALDETLVFIGNQMNWLCSVQFVNITNINCRTPPYTDYYDINLPQPVVLTNRLMVDSTCDNNGSCGFKYISEASSPQLINISTSRISNGIVMLNGSNLDIGISMVVLVNKLTEVVTVVVPIVSSSTFIKFIVPQIQSGPYDVKIRLDPIGQTNSLLLNIPTYINSIVPNSVSINGGKFELTGFGLPTSWPNQNYIIKILANGIFINPSITSNTSTSLLINIPPSTHGTIFIIYITSPLTERVQTSITSSNSSTPQVVLNSYSPSTAGIILFTFTQLNFQSQVPRFIEIYSIYNKNQIYIVHNFQHTLGSITFTYDLTGGRYGFKFLFSNGWATCSSTTSISISMPVMSSVITSYNGGYTTLTGSSLSKSATVKINGFKTQLQNVTETDAKIVIPSFVSSLSQQYYNLTQPKKLTSDEFSIISDTISNQNAAFDNTHGTTYISTSNNTCYIGISVGDDLFLNLTRIRFFPYSRWMIAANYLIGGYFQASIDGSIWVKIANIDSSVHSGWNTIQIGLVGYRQFRFVHNAVSRCKLSQLQFQGILFSAVSPSSLITHTVDMVYEDGENSFTFSSQIQFRQDHTPIVQSLSQLYGHVFGNYTLTIYGKYLNFTTPTVLIDGQTCPIITSSPTQLICQVPSRLTLPTQNTFIVMVGNTKAITYHNFSYVMRWSDIRTWGTDLFPVDGDLIYVPAGMNLYVDQSTPKLKGILVQNGTIIFADQSDMTISVGFITIVGGKFIAGTQTNPYLHQLIFIMYGGYYTSQQPMFGNKGIGCLECHISMHGEIRQYTWSSLLTTILPGETKLTVVDHIDWRVGQQIAIASTSHNHYESEDRIITDVNGNTITVDRPFSYLHFAGVQNYGSDILQMRAEVALLTRNIKIMGDESSLQSRYGSHLMMMGSSQNGFIGQISYTQFTHCGQPKIIGRYCIHYHMNGDLSNSFTRGNSVHHSFARVITIHGGHFLTVEYNVGYRVEGHNYFIQDGIETNNVIQYNLAISSIQSWTMLQTDISVSSFWITHPSNHFRYNHAAGSDYYGFWYQIKDRSDGPSACTDVCPMGNALGQNRDNVAHSNKKYGLRITKLSPRTYPCSNIYIADQIDPWKNNPGIVGIFANYLLYKNGEIGLLAEETGSLMFINITTAQNLKAGVQFYVTDYTKDLTTFKNSVIIGQTLTNSPVSVNGVRGIVTPRLGNIRIDNIRFYNFPTTTRSLQTCSQCDNPLLFTNSVQQIFISNITYHNVTGYKLFMNGPKRQIIFDIDGSFTTNAFDGKQRKSAAIVRNYKHLTSDPACLPTSNVLAWDNTIACDETVKLARVTFSNVHSQGVFNLVGLKAQQINSVNDTVPSNSTSYSQIFTYYSSSYKAQSSISQRKAYAMPYIAGRIYNIWWLTGLDFTHLSMTSSNTLLSSDPAICFKFNYTLNRQLYEVGPSRPNIPYNYNSYFVRANGQLDADTTYNGEYYHQNQQGNRTFQICASGKNRTYFQTIDVNAIYCRYLCPAPPAQFYKQEFVRYWSNGSQWPNGVVPQQGDNITIHSSWTIIIDTDFPNCDLLIIDGDIILQDTKDRHIICNAIWIRAGSLRAGSASSPYTHQLLIQLNGMKNDAGFTLSDSYVGSKFFVITGVLELYGISPATISTKLTATAFASSSQMTVQSTQGWSIGDELVLSPSFSSTRQYERVTITLINGTTVYFQPSLNFTHYGAASTTINNEYGTLDTRTTIGHITRNIKIVSGPDSGWGYTVVIYQLWDNYYNRDRAGRAIFNSVQFTQGGQYDTQSASLVLNNNGDSTMGQSIVTKSSFSFCLSFCIKADIHNNADITDNVFYLARKYHLKASTVTLFNFNRNVMIGAIIRPTITGKEPVACVQLTSVDPINDVLQISNNICQGSDLNGFVLPFVPCDDIESQPFIANTVGSADVGFMLIGSGNGDCLAFSGAKAFACNIGQISSPPNTKSIIFSKFIMADNKRSISLRFGLEGNDRTAYLTDSYITQISRPTCIQCYGPNKIDCSNNLAIRLLATTINGQLYPNVFDSSFDEIHKQETFDSKAYFTNVVFDNYRLTYTEDGLVNCSDNVVFRSHPDASDLTGSTYMWNIKCTNCQFQALVYFDPPKTSELGWTGGCGDLQCTGKSNYFLQDKTGTLLPQAGVLVANNDWMSNLQGCTFNTIINGFYCLRDDISVLQYQSIAPDYKTRINWPVTISPQKEEWTSKTNGFKQWQWAGKQLPSNKRLGRFITVLQLHKKYNMSFESNPPDDMRLQIQKRVETGNKSDWIIVMMYYPFPNTIQIQANGKTIRPIFLLDGGAQQSLNTSLCGSNKYFYRNNTIHFVITGVNCLVRVSLTNSVQLTIRFSMNINKFFSNQCATRLVDRMCAILQINDQSRVKIVGIYNGSTTAVVTISEAIPLMNESTLITPEQQTQSLANSIKTAQLLTQYFNNGVLQTNLTLGTILSASIEVLSVKSGTTDYSQSQTEQNNDNSKQAIMIGFSIASGCLIIIIGAIIYYKLTEGTVQKVQNIISLESNERKVNGQSMKDKKQYIFQVVTEDNISEIIIQQRK